ncbi:MAG: (2Fe-2S)-binding protein [Candidatus Sericytochromatia bacterium]|nr:(2Fe-2S)-binding protein [Candidatus Tanganyikabacteria bacterium]
MATTETKQPQSQQGDHPWRLQFTCNGEAREIDIDPHHTLLEVLREDLGLTGTKGACHEGECGSCTVLVDGVPMNACLILAPQMEGREVVTIEGLASGDVLDPVQEAFVKEGAVQCGFCTPGLVLSAKALIAKHARPSLQEVREGLEGNICRCTGYMKVLGAVMAAAQNRENV